MHLQTDARSYCNRSSVSHETAAVKAAQRTFVQPACSMLGRESAALRKLSDLSTLRIPTVTLLDPIQDFLLHISLFFHVESPDQPVSHLFFIVSSPGLPVRVHGHVGSSLLVLLGGCWNSRLLVEFDSACILCSISPNFVSVKCCNTSKREQLNTLPVFQPFPQFFPSLSAWPRKPAPFTFRVWPTAAPQPRWRPAASGQT